MQRQKRQSRGPCQFPGCKVKEARYRPPEATGITDLRTCGRHAYPSVGLLQLIAERIGATIDYSGERGQRYNVDAPPGKVWAASSTHALCVDWGTPGDSYGDEGDRHLKAEAIMDALARMADGLDNCDEPDCDCCNPDD